MSKKIFAAKLSIFSNTFLILIKVFMGISAGIYRYVCSNGLVIADSVFESYKIKHLGDKDNDVINAVANITAIKPKLLEKISKFESITLNQNEKESFLQSALPLRFE